MFAIKTILFPTDFSPHSELAFNMACSLARDYGARLVVAHVAEPPLLYAGEGVVFPPPENWIQSAEERLAAIHAPDEGIAFERHLIQGDPIDEILALAKEVKPDLIVMGTHGRRGFGRLLIGSVAEAVLRKAPCPVLTVKMPQASAAAAAVKGTAEPAHV
jgi:nucleotide-binding universal stress UspA family protein